jgi:hypothetical protein
MKLTEILSIVSVIAAFATFSTAVSAEKSAMEKDFEQMDKDLTNGPLGERFTLQMGTSGGSDDICVKEFEKAKMNIKCTTQDDCEIKLTTEHPACKGYKLTVKQ